MTGVSTLRSIGDPSRRAGYDLRLGCADRRRLADPDGDRAGTALVGDLDPIDTAILDHVQQGIHDGEEDCSDWLGRRTTALTELHDKKSV